MDILLGSYHAVAKVFEYTISTGAKVDSSKTLLQIIIE